MSAPGGSLALRLECRAGRTVASSLHHRGALRTLRPHYPDTTGCAIWTLINPGGGYLSGDRYKLEFDLAPGAHAVVLGQSATKIYRCPSEGSVTQRATVTLGPGAVLDWRAEPVIAYAGARYRQHTRVIRDPSATLLLSEVVTPGWSPTGADFDYAGIHLLTEVERPDGALDTVDNLVLNPNTDALSDDALHGGFSHLGSLVALDQRIDPALVEDLAASLDADGSRAGITLTGGPGLVVRVLADSSEAARRLLDTVADRLVARWFARAPLERHQW